MWWCLEHGQTLQLVSYGRGTPVMSEVPPVSYERGTPVAPYGVGLNPVGGGG